jgi:putative membrane protein
MMQVLPGRDRDRELVERADAVLRSLQDTEITDPTVFVKSAALGSIAAIELAKLAQSKSRNADVRGFAAGVQKNQEAIHAELAKVARRKGLDVPTSLVYEDEQVLDRIAAKSGPELDVAYSQQMITESRKALALFEAATRMEDAQLAAFAKKTLPTLQEQQRRATALAEAASP